MGKLVREELWEERANPIIRIGAEVRQGFGAIKIQYICGKIRVYVELGKLGFLAN